jgi:PKD repeat protein
LWNFGDGNSSSLQNPVNAYSQAGLYNASLQATSDSGCSSINNLVVFVKYQPVANFTPSGITCAQSATQFFNQSSVLFPGTISNYSWDFGDNNTDTAANPIHVYNNQNFYPVKLIVVSNDGCSDTAAQTIEVFAPFDVDFEFENICLGDTVSFSDVTNSFSIINRQWNFGDGSFFVSEKNPNHKFNVADTYLVTLQAENAIGCIDTTSKSVVIVEKPKADFTNLIGCEDASYAPLDNSTSAEAITNRLWLINGSFYNSVTPQFTYSDTGIYPIQLTVKTQSGCVDSITKNISIKPRPTAAFGFTPLYGEAPVEITGINQSTGASTYEWSFGDGDFSADENPKHTYTQNGTYTIQLKAISAFGCEDSISLSYLVIPTDLDIAVTEITTNQVVLPDGNIAVSITAKVSNLGTRQITNYTLYANVGNGGVITETWNGLLSSGQTMLYTFTAKFILSTEKAETYVCVKATDVNNGEAEIALFNNQQCTPLTEMWQIAGPTPNPSSGASSVSIILPKAGTVTVSIIDLMGRIVWPAQELNLPAGRTDYALPIQQLLGAEYFIQLTYNDEKTVRKLFVRK